MFSKKTTVLLMALICSQFVYVAAVDAGPLRDWLFKRRCARQQARGQQTCPQPQCPPVDVQMPTTCQTTCEQTCSRVVVNYVPYTAYRTSWERVPVTQYRQTQTTDPCTGCTVTCNRPCTTYSWRMKQVPYTTYRPCYRRETYKVPVTYTQQFSAPAGNSCQTGGCATGTCGVPTVATPVQLQAPTGTIVPNGGYYQAMPNQVQNGTMLQPSTIGSPTPADQQPTLNPQNMNKPVIEGNNSSFWPSQQPQIGGTIPMQDPNPAARLDNNAAPQLLNPFNKSAEAPSIKRWNYSPVRLASYQQETPIETAASSNREFIAEISQPQTTQSPATKPQPRVNEGWRSGSW